MWEAAQQAASETAAARPKTRKQHITLGWIASSIRRWSYIAALLMTNDDSLDLITANKTAKFVP